MHSRKKGLEAVLNQFYPYDFGFANTFLDRGRVVDVSQALNCITGSQYIGQNYASFDRYRIDILIRFL